MIQIASNAIIGTVASKLIDSVLSSKISQKNDKKKWIRERKLNIFSNLSEEIIHLTCENLEEKKTNIKNSVSKIILLINDKDLIRTLNNYMFILDEYECYKSDINLNNLNEELMDTLRLYIERF
ncbi:hypothetical protein CP965_13160 [Halarcobacter mediterraneus]|uniref:Uncharacterized protein n=1 Tax=Halarcobacter mediterraneus TaxID=2023153 RepID=A0A4Q1ASV6_9BACT|nr:hypothetical protein [Halarcobacter mediterraneus]RXK11711.1 hypothetical protein CP965_13160 [Halarcobacter mediterraneus]|eukprot:gnl/Chilomastix_cuspidata/10514.p1 GENE.gnl/Chilomastix_cuspidata/10514~~gnl/Chilomastix_cuspidata/10514.p1  ORF type:complete len:124 (+),score=7.16 gnl/Chilomastix_cuspidata/10514:53-424(+)